MQTQQPSMTTITEEGITIERRSAWAAGWITFAGVVMIIAGVFHGIVGFAEIIDRTYVAVGSNYAFAFNVSAWGWLHLGIGTLLVLAGLGVFTGNVAARAVGVLMAGLSGIAAFMWLPYAPVWAVAIIAIDVAVIWALTVHGRDIRYL
ncbi:MAG: DUF7144 family membrane protein [Acidimicrobiia bacterium]